jgi:predicted secreted Zn-dependent protease
MISLHTLCKPVFHSHVCHYPFKTVALRVVIETLILAALAFAAMSGIAQASPTANTPTIQTPPQTQNAVPQTLQTPVQAANTPQPQTPAQSQPAAPKCVKGSMPQPAALPLSNQQPGVKVVVDAPNYYTVFGTTISQAKAQIAQCSPVENGRYAAVTTSAINWQFSYYKDSTTLQCKISTVAVGVHTAFLYPSWNTPNQQWRTFMASITIHEQGHAAMDLAAANAILTDLQTMPLTDCATIGAAADYRANGHIAALRQANASYDTDTNHGATQGARL